LEGERRDPRPPGQKRAGGTAEGSKLRGVNIAADVLGIFGEAPGESAGFDASERRLEMSDRSNASCAFLPSVHNFSAARPFDFRRASHALRASDGSER